MILRALVDYYEILAQSGEISRPGYCKAKVSFALNLTPKGELLNVIPLKEEALRGKKTVEVPRSLEVPEQVKKSSGIQSNFLCENSGYVLGVDTKGKPERSRQCFEAFATLHHRVLDGVSGVAAEAVLAFIDAWQPEQAQQCEVLISYYGELVSGVNIVFMIQGKGYAHDDPEIKTAWNEYHTNNSNMTQMRCLVTGKLAPVARLHPNIKGVRGAQSSGASLVSFNAPAFESFGHEQKDDTGQGINAPVSEYAAFAYTTALNYLISDADHRQNLGDTTVVYWAVSPQKIYRDFFKFSLNPMPQPEQPGETKVDRQAEGILQDLFSKLVLGKPVAGDVEGFIDKETRFYVLGLAPSAARLSVRFFMENSFGNFLKNLKRHYDDLEIGKNPNDFEYLPVWKLLDETVSSKVRVKEASPLLSGEVMRSILTGAPYPDTLLSNVLLRIRAEQDDEDKHTYKITRGRAAIIKACLLRRQNNKNYKEVLTVSLNEDSTNRAYVLGRLFAVLEKAQQDANPGINSTIKDRYFTSACATPASVFPILLRLSVHHIAKSDYGSISERKVGDLMQKLQVENNPFPAHLSLDEQGIFILGYYHQQRANFTKSNKEDK